MNAVPEPARATQAERRARSRARLLEATARRISRAGYANLGLAAVAAEAGYTRGALYHQFRDKDELVLAALQWVRDTWYDEVGAVLEEEMPPADALVEIARRHAVYCRRDIARVMLALRVEFAADPGHPVGAEVHRQTADVVEHLRRLIIAGRRDGTIPVGPPARALAAASMAAVEAAVTTLAGRPGHDEDIARRTMEGILGL